MIDMLSMIATAW